MSKSKPIVIKVFKGTHGLPDYIAPQLVDLDGKGLRYTLNTCFYWNSLLGATADVGYENPRDPEDLLTKTLNNVVDGERLHILIAKFDEITANGEYDDEQRAYIKSTKRVLSELASSPWLDADRAALAEKLKGLMRYEYV